MKALIRNVLLVGAVSLIGWYGYTFFFGGDESATDTIARSQVALEGQRFLRELQDLRNIEFDTGLFADPRFQSLVDERQTPDPEPYGRDNPFAPVGGAQ